MSAEIVTMQDLERFRVRLLADLAKMMQKPESLEPLMRSGQVRKMLNISPGTLRKLRAKGILSYARLDGSFRYRLADVKKALEGLKQGVSPS
jgi:hypothetical protein